MNPFRIVPWDHDFLPEVALLAQARPGAALIFPHDRPRRYMRAQFPEGKVALLPPMLTGGELFHHLAKGLLQHLPLAESLDQAALLREALLNVAPRSGVLKRLARGGLDEFLPWGLRLADVFEECFSEMVEVSNLAQAEAEPVADAILAALGDISQVYLKLLQKRGLSTAGLMARNVALAVEQGANLARLPLLAKAPVLAGFVRLSGAENKLFYSLWHMGADVCLHSDPALVQACGHWSCGDHLAWLARWGAQAELTAKPTGNKVALHFLAAGDLHAQLRVMRQDMDAAMKQNSHQSLAAVLQKPDLLGPVLHHLPDADLNISLGYPLERSQLGRLMELLLVAAESNHYWQAVLDVIRHPFVRGLGNGEAAPLLRHLEEQLRRGQKQADVAALWAALASADAPSWFASLEPVLFGNWQQATCLENMAFCLDELVALLLREGNNLWPRHPLDAECLFRLGARLAPGLRALHMAGETLGFAPMASVLRQAMARERVPFEADPIIGLQALGLLETRLLRFDRIFLPDLTEDSLPGPPPRDPLLPEAARLALGLPPGKSRHTTLGHAFFRLLAGAKEAWLYWQEGVDSTGLFDSRKLRSPFVEELVWRAEKRLGHPLKNGDPPLRSATATFAYEPQLCPEPLVRSPQMQAKMAEFLRHPLSSTSLDAYIACPMRFWQERVCGVRPAEAVNEGDDPGALGLLLHDVLAKMCQPFLNRAITRADMQPLPEIFAQSFAQSPLAHTLPAQSSLMLLSAAPLRLRNFVEKQPEQTRILLLEEKLCAPMGSLVLEGIVDRLDMRQEGITIIDYKSGSLPNINPKAWTNAELWAAMANWLASPALQASPSASATLLDSVALAFPSVQLPLYIYLCHQNNHCAVNAAWVRLADDGAEVPLFPQMEAADRHILITENIPLLLSFLTSHLQLAPAFHARPGRSCAYCPLAAVCATC